jgi:hypothetical protein
MGISSNFAITPKFIEKHIDMPFEWGDGGFSTNPVIKPEFIEKHIDKPWSWGKWGLSSNNAITPEFVERHFDKPWDWVILSENPSITPDFVERHLDKPWVWGQSYERPNKGLSSNPSITHDFIERHIDKYWSWGENGLSMNPAITPEFVERHYDKQWNWGLNGLSNNPSITPEFIERNITERWKWGEDGLSSNLAITREFVERHINKPWDWDDLSKNFSVSPHSLLKGYKCTPFKNKMFPLKFRINPAQAEVGVIEYDANSVFVLKVNVNLPIRFGRSICEMFDPRFAKEQWQIWFEREQKRARRARKHFFWEKPWWDRWDGISHYTMTPKSIDDKTATDKQIFKLINWGASFRSLSENPLITTEFIERHLDKPWNWGSIFDDWDSPERFYTGLSSNNIITAEFVERHLDKPWNWGEGGLSMNPLNVHLANNPIIYIKDIQLHKQNQKNVNLELSDISDIPPNIVNKQVFKRGGPGYWESWNDILNLKIGGGKRYKCKEKLYKLFIKKLRLELHCFRIQLKQR